MKIWRLDTDADRYINIRLKNYEADREKIVDEFTGEPMLESWTPVLVETEGRGKASDQPHLLVGVPVFNKKAVEALNDLISQHVEYLPLIHDKYELYAINVLNQIDAIDYSTSKYKTFDDGTFYRFIEYGFKQDIIMGEHIFKIPEESTRIYVSDEFRNRVIEKKLKGFVFIEVWDSTVTPEVKEERKQRYAEMLQEIERNKGKENSFDDAMDLVVGEDKAIASGKWKIQRDKTGEILIATLEEDGRYKWMNVSHYPPILIGMKWHVVEKSTDI